jgi:hypothetical protein
MTSDTNNKSAVADINSGAKLAEIKRRYAWHARTKNSVRGKAAVFAVFDEIALFNDPETAAPGAA